MRSRWPALYVVSILALVVGTSLPATAAPTSGPPPSGPGPALVDRDGDHISDDLQLKLSDAALNERFDIVVSFSAPGQAAAALRAHRVIATLQLPIINGFAANATAAQIKGLSNALGVERIDEDFTVSITNDVANQDFGTGAARADFGLTGTGVGICIVDTGVDPGHEQTDKVVEFYDAVNGKSQPYDDHGHGTHVAGTAAGDGVGSSSKAATYMGVAPGAPLYAAKVLNADGSGTESQVIAGVNWCAQINGVHIISMSLGTGGSSDGNDNLSKAVNKAVTEKGKVAVVAAGNSGDTPYTIGSPGAAAYAITVGAAADHGGVAGTANHSLGVYLTPWSSRGPTADERKKPDVTAPGHSITSAKANSGTGYSTFSGTSMATPFVSGTIALALEHDPSLTPDQVRAALEGTSQDRGPTGKDNDWGAGLLDGYAFLAQVAGAAGQTNFPAYQRTNGSVANNGLWSWSFEVSDTTTPVAVMVTIDGQAKCTFWFFGCLIWEWDPDLDARLIDPGGNVVATSECPARGDCSGAGRQETLHIMPAVTGTYTVEVYPYGGSPNNGKGGSFWLDVSTGPVSGAGTPDAPPTVAITNPAPDAVVSGNVVVTADASDDVGISQVEFFVDGASIGIDSTAPYEAAWDSTTVGDGAHTITATAADSIGQTAGDSVSVTVDNLDTPPSVTLTNPAEGAVVNGSVTVSADAADDKGVTQVEFFVDGGSIGVDTTAPYSVLWTTGADGAHNVTATATDTVGQTASDSASVTVDNTAPSVAITSPADGATVSGTVNVVATASDATTGVTQVEFFVDGGSVGVDTNGADGWSINWDTTGASNEGHTITATAADGAGNAATSDPVGVTVDNSVSSSTIHVGDLDDASVKLQKGNWMGVVTVLVHDGSETPLAGVTVTGVFTQNGWTSAAMFCDTNGAGTCTIDSGTFPAKDGKASFTVTGLSETGYTYESAANHDPDGDSDGTSISLSKG